MGSALETLGSQYNGARNYDDVAVVFWKCMIILSAMVIPIGFLWYYCGYLFGLLGIQADVCEIISTYIRIHILTLPVDVFNVSYENYLIAIGVMEPSMWAELTVNVGVLLLNCLFINKFNLGYEFLAWSWVISVYCSGVVHFVLSWNYPAVQRTMRPFTWKALSGWGEFISLGLPGTIMLCSEWWAYEVLVLFASILGTEEVAAQSIILQAASLAFMIPCGLGEAATSLVGNALGAQKYGLAVHLSRLSLYAILVVETLLALCVLFLGKYFVNLCTPDEAVRKMASDSLLFLAVFAIVDGLQGVAAGILKGAGQQAVCAFFNVVSFYVIGLPMAYYLCFHTLLKVNGLMMGIAIGASFQVTVSLYLIFLRESDVFRPTIHKSVSIGSMASSVNSVDNRSPGALSMHSAGSHSSEHGQGINRVRRHGQGREVGSSVVRYTELTPLHDIDKDIEKAVYHSVSTRVVHPQLLAAGN
jgi:MATE family multidrug resistance protein